MGSIVWGFLDQPGCPYWCWDTFTYPWLEMQGDCNSMKPRMKWSSNLSSYVLLSWTWKSDPRSNCPTTSAMQPWRYTYDQHVHYMQRFVRTEGDGPSHSTGLPCPRQYLWFRQVTIGPETSLQLRHRKAYHSTFKPLRGKPSDLSQICVVWFSQSRPNITGLVCLPFVSCFLQVPHLSSMIRLMISYSLETWEGALHCGKTLAAM